MKRVWGILCLVVLFAWTGCRAGGPKQDCLTVREAWAKARSLAGQQVRVRGRGWFMTQQTLQRCIPPRCDCNASSGSFVLLDESIAPQEYRGNSQAGIWLAPSSLECKGDECHLVCEPFDPRGAELFELVGTLAIEGSVEPAGEIAINRLLLKDLDVAASRQLVAEQWLPLATGRFTITLRTP